MNLKTHHKAILALITANLIWGAASPIFKLALENIPPFTLAFSRFFFAMIIILPFAINNLQVRREDWKNLILLSLTGITFNISFFFFGLKYAPSINAPMIASSGPVFLYFLSIFVLHEKPHLKILTGIIISLLGVMIIIGQPLLSIQIDSKVLIGNLFFLLATFGAVGHAIFSKEILIKYKAVSITFWSFFIGSLTFLPFFIGENLKQNFLSTLDIRGIIGLVFGVFLSSLLAYLLFEWGLSKIPAQEIGIYTYIDPVIATLIAIPLLEEHLSLLFITGSVLIFLGIYIAEGRLHWHPLHKLSR